MEFPDKLAFKNSVSSLADEYEALYQEQCNLQEQCKKYREKIEHYVDQIKSVTKDLERLRDDMHNNNITFDPPYTLSYLVQREKIQHPLNVEYTAEIIDVTVICRTSYSPDGKYLAIGSNRSIRVYVIENWSSHFDFTIPGEQDVDKHIRALAWIPNSPLLVSGCEDHIIRIFDINKNEKIHEIDLGLEIFDIKASHNGEYFAVATNSGPLVLFNAKTFEVIGKLKTEEPCETQFPVCVAISDDDKVVAGGYNNNKVIFWSFETKTSLLDKVIHDNNIYSLCFYKNSTMLATGSLDKTIKLWKIGDDFKSLEMLKALTGHSDYVLNIAVDPTSRWLISGSKDKTICMTDLETMEMVYALGIHTNSVITVDFCPTEPQFCSGSGDMSIKIWSYQDAE